MCQKLYKAMNTKDMNQTSCLQETYPLREEVNKLNSTYRVIWRHCNTGILQVLHGPTGKGVPHWNCEWMSTLTTPSLPSIFTVPIDCWEYVGHHHTVGVGGNHMHGLSLLEFVELLLLNTEQWTFPSNFGLSRFRLSKDHLSQICFSFNILTSVLFSPG